MIDAWVKGATQVLAVKGVAELPKWVVGLGVVGSLIYVAKQYRLDEAAAAQIDEYLPKRLRSKTLRTMRAGRDF